MYVYLTICLRLGLGDHTNAYKPVSDSVLVCRVSQLDKSAERRTDVFNAPSTKAHDGLISSRCIRFRKTILRILYENSSPFFNVYLYFITVYICNLVGSSTMTPLL